MEPEEEEIEQDDDLGFENQDDEGDEDSEEPEAPAEEDASSDEEAEPAAVSPYVAEAGEDDDDAALKDLMTPEAYAAMRRVMARQIGQQMQAMTAANIHVTTAAAQNPELFRVHGARIQHNLAQLAPELRSKPEAVNIAIAGLFIEEARSKGPGAALAKLAGLVANAEKPAPRAKVPIPAAQRPPSPSSGTRSAAPIGNTEERRVKVLMERYGLSAAEARAAMVDEGVLR